CRNRLRRRMNRVRYAHAAFGAGSSDWLGLSRQRLNNRNTSSCVDFALKNKTRLLEQRLVFLKRALLSAEQRQHVDIEHLRPVWSRISGHNRFDQKQRASWIRRSANCLQDRDCLVVGPIMDNLHKNVGIALRQWVFEEI